MGILYNEQELIAKAEEYCSLHELSIAASLIEGTKGKEFGRGSQGMVFRTSRNTAIKAYSRKKEFLRERDVYRRLRDKNIHSIRGLAIPRILNWDDRLLVFEMSLVRVPFVLDFGGAYLDAPPDHIKYDEDWDQIGQEDFGSNWTEVKKIMHELEVTAGVFLVDVHPQNIKFE